MAGFHTRQVAAEEAGALFYVALRHPFLEPVVSDRLADIHGREHYRMAHGNQSGNFWQGEICAIRRTFVPYEIRIASNKYFLRSQSFLARCTRYDMPLKGATRAAFTTMNGLLPFECCRQKILGALPCVGSIGFAITIFVVGIFKSVTGIVVDFDFDLLSHLIERLSELANVCGGYATILRAE